MSLARFARSFATASTNSMRFKYCGVHEITNWKEVLQTTYQRTLDELKTMQDVPFNRHMAKIARWRLHVLSKTNNKEQFEAAIGHQGQVEEIIEDAENDLELIRYFNAEGWTPKDKSRYVGYAKQFGEDQSPCRVDDAFFNKYPPAFWEEYLKLKDPLAKLCDYNSEFTGFSGSLDGALKVLQEKFPQPAPAAPAPGAPAAPAAPVTPSSEPYIPKEAPPGFAETYLAAKALEKEGIKSAASKL